MNSPKVFSVPVKAPMGPPSDDNSVGKSSNQGKFTALTQGSRRSISDSPLLVATRTKSTLPKAFIVETIKNHKIDKNGNLMFQVKWMGFEIRTRHLRFVLPFSNQRAFLSVSGDEILNQYFDTIGGRDKIFEESDRAAKTKKGRQSTNGTFSIRPKRLQRNEAHVGDETLLATTKPWNPPSGSWEDEIETIGACEEDDNGKLIVYLIWKNGQKTKHEAQIIYKKCPQKMLQFYEKHVRFIGTEKNAMRDGTRAF
ncbi:hypothetical protein EDB81DRAFT_848989 [Dactylonectria macrodidyma]|uniref:Chromo shadow domain-containing protein n=1 Tax=Dactylonectria macrodidyma TaxID=307937 RepID=A0A9P9D362_9HYPO|nr:hypothetical protein EDB81DRAFT_848989 [Dactylonectria macrodidyma]